MASQLRTAGRGRTRLAAGFALAAGSTALVMGALLLVTGLAPMFAPRIDTATVIAPTAAEQPRASPDPSPAATPADVPGPVPQTAAGPYRPVDGVSFHMRVAAVGYAAVVRQGVSLSVLSGGPGHYPATAWPGQRGNVGIAAHNTQWLSFNRLKVGDRVEVRTEHGLYVYEITGSKVVDPGDRTVLAPTQERRLTLTTCYPLWAGTLATKRLVFTAREVGGVA